MVEEVLELAFPGGALLAAGVAVGAAFGRQLRPVAKEAIKLGLTAGALVQEAAAEAYERGQDLVAEARYEHAQEHNGGRPAEAEQPPAEAEQPPQQRTARRAAAATRR
jgi:hypothetical protein